VFSAFFVVISVLIGFFLPVDKAQKIFKKGNNGAVFSAFFVVNRFLIEFSMPFSVFKLLMEGLSVIFL